MGRNGEMEQCKGRFPGWHGPIPRLGQCRATASGKCWPETAKICIQAERKALEVIVSKPAPAPQVPPPPPQQQSPAGIVNPVSTA